MKKIIAIIFIAISSFAQAQPPGYYGNALGKNGAQLQAELHQIIDGHNIQSWPLWSAFATTDNKGNNKLWDMYSDIPTATPNYVYTLGSDQCGQYNSEGDCYNHEHVWPKTYYNDASPMNSDLHHIIPTDGWVNNKRGNFPYGVATGQGWTGTNGSKTGSSSNYSGYNGLVFEPIDEYKGDVARMYFYTSTRYLGQDNGWKNWEMAAGAQLSQDAVQLLLQWHISDPVDAKEIDRNNAVYAIQGNRNPFIDYPIFAECIWGNKDCTSLSSADLTLGKIKIYPNPVTNLLHIEMPSKDVLQSTIIVLDMLGRELLQSNKQLLSTEELPKGIYTIQVRIKGNILSSQFVKH